MTPPLYELPGIGGGGNTQEYVCMSYHLEFIFDFFLISFFNYVHHTQLTHILLPQKSLSQLQQNSKILEN